MDFNKDKRAFLANFPLKKMSGQQKLLVLVGLLSGGKLNKQISTKDIKKEWLKGVLEVKYHPVFYSVVHRLRVRLGNR